MDEIQPLKNVLPQVLEKLQSPEARTRTKLVMEWPQMAGTKIAAHTKPTLSTAGELRVWVDQPTLAYELSQKYRAAILKRAQACLGEEQIKSIRFYVGQIR